MNFTSYFKMKWEHEHVYEHIWIYTVAIYYFIDLAIYDFRVLRKRRSMDLSKSIPRIYALR